MRYNTQDRGSYVAGKRTPFPGGLEYADDIMIMFLQGSTQVDALAHIWYDETTYNGYSADTTVGGLSRASVLPLANRGIVGRAVLVDIARYRNVDALDRGEEFTLDEMLDAARSQDLTIHPHDVLLVRTGWIPMFYEKGAAEFYRPPFEEPGLLYEPKVAKWFHEQEIVGWGTDTIGNELSVQPETLIRGSALHAALMRNLGVIFIEMLWLEELAKECAADGRYEFFFVCSPLKIHGATGSPVNPIAIR
jgi:kynurenine formamidase